MKELFLFGMLLANKEAATPDAAALHNLGARYFTAGNYAEAEDIYKRALSLWATPREAATTLNNLGALYRAQGRYREAEDAYKKALDALPQEKSAKALANLAELYRVQGRNSEARALAEKAAVITPEEAGPQIVIAAVDRAEGRNAEALQRYQSIAKMFAADPTIQANTQASIAELLIVTGRYSEAEAAARKAVALTEGVANPTAAAALNNLAQALRLQNRLIEPEALYKRALTIWKATLGEQHPDYARGLRNFAEYNMQVGRYDVAQDMYQQAEKTLRRQLGKDNPDTVAAVKGLNNAYALRGLILPLRH